MGIVQRSGKSIVQKTKIRTDLETVGGTAKFAARSPRATELGRA